MNLRRTRFPLIRLPNEIEFTMYIIKEELKCRHHFQKLREIGFIECPFEPSLDTLILQCFRLDPGIDEILTAYNQIMDKRSKKIEPKPDSIQSQALKAYIDIKDLKKKLTNGYQSQDLSSQ